MSFSRAAILSFALAAGLPALALGQEVSAPEWLVQGTDYYGHGVQDDGSGWTIRLSVTGPEQVQILYPSIPCGGVLQMAARSAGAAEFVETITTGTGNCVSGGTITLEPLVPGALRYRWRNGRQTAEGTLVALPEPKMS
jgi:hypothetical protein